MPETELSLSYRENLKELPEVVRAIEEAAASSDRTVEFTLRTFDDRPFRCYAAMGLAKHLGVDVIMRARSSKKTR